ncbi:MAG: acyl carrier protein [Planctomycetaceae bacterium]|nr:acyl carrier protein [Planctomycetaceae bacterium]
MLERLQQVIGKVFEVDSATVSARTVIRQLPGWDSLKHLKLIMAVETEFSRELTPEQIESLKTVGDIAAVIV